MYRILLFILHSLSPLFKAIVCQKIYCFNLHLIYPALVKTFVYPLKWWKYCTDCSIPVISEEEAREALIEYCKKKCCHGKRAARAMVIGNMQSTSAYHVCSSLSLNIQLVWLLAKLDVNIMKSATNPLLSMDHVSGTVYLHQFATQHYQLLSFLIDLRLASSCNSRSIWIRNRCLFKYCN